MIRPKAMNAHANRAGVGFPCGFPCQNTCLAAFACDGACEWLASTRYRTQAFFHECLQADTPT